MTTNLVWRNMLGFHLPGLIVQGFVCCRAHLEPVYFEYKIVLRVQSQIPRKLSALLHVRSVSWFNSWTSLLPNAWGLFLFIGKMAHLSGRRMQLEKVSRREIEMIASPQQQSYMQDVHWEPAGVATNCIYLSIDIC